MASSVKTIFITGCSSGIGLASARLFAAKGWNVVATLRDPADAPPDFAMPNVLVAALDVSDRASIETAVEQALKRFGRIDVLVNNAGYGLNGPVEGATEGQMRAQFDVNVFGPIRVAQAVLPSMREKGAGLVVNVSSIAGMIGMPISPLYVASKHAVEGLSESMRFELKPFGIRVKLLQPGGTRTDFISRSAQWTSHGAYGDYVDAARAMTNSLDANLAPVSKVVDKLYDLVTDKSDRLRYTAAPGPYVIMNRLLPDALWRRLISSALAWHSRRAANGDG